jgi:peptide/nickel transport system substrate-binding protein
VAQDLPILKAWGEVTADLLKRFGMIVDFAAVDWGTVIVRWSQKSPPGQGGWQMYHTWQAGGVCIDPTNKIIRANGQLALNGWPKIPQVEAELAAWFEAQTLDEEKTIARRLNKAVLDVRSMQRSASS